MSGVARMTAGMKIAPTRPEMRIDDSTPRGACRPASSVSSPNVPAVSKPNTTKAAMKKPRANVAGMFPFCAASEPSKLVRTLTGCTFAKISRMIANTNMPRISVATPMLLRIDSSRTP